MNVASYKEIILAALVFQGGWGASALLLCLEHARAW